MRLSAIAPVSGCILYMPLALAPAASIAVANSTIAPEL